MRALKDGWVTVLFNAFLGDKAATMQMAGGNTDSVYAGGDMRRAFAESLRDQHPDCVTVSWKFGRWHHHVDYSRFRSNALKLKPGVVPNRTINEYGMCLRKAHDLHAGGSADAAIR